MNVSVIIPAHNSSATLAGCLDSLASQETSHSFEVIVVDDGSIDGTQKIAETRGVKLLFQKHTNPAAARNLGASVAQGDILLFVDSDCAPRPDWIEKMLGPFQDQQIVGVKGAYLTKQKGVLPRFIQVEFEEKYDRMLRQRFIDFVDTYSAGYRRSVFLRSGGFDPIFPASSAEDVEFAFRLANRGFKMVFMPEARVYHQHPESLMAYLTKKFRYGYWRARVYSQHPTKLVRDSYTPRAMKAQILLGAFSLIALAFALTNPSYVLAFLLVMVIFASTTVTAMKRTYAQDKVLAWMIPCLLYLRSLAQAVGLLTGGVATMGALLLRRKSGAARLDEPRAKG